jgi:predicted transcriptional regulator
MLLTMEFEKEVLEREVLGILEEVGEGLTISDIVRMSGFSRSAVRTILARMEGGGKVGFRNVGMAKLYFSKELEGG